MKNNKLRNTKSTKSTKSRRYKRSIYRKKVKQSHPIVTETIPNMAIQPNQPYRQVIPGILGLRAPQIARLYQFYRIKSVTYTYKPNYDSYDNVAVGNGPVQVPYMYMKMIRAGDNPGAVGINWFTQQGAKSKRFDDKSVVIKYTPNWLASATTAGSISGAPNFGWLSTDQAPDDAAFALSTSNFYGHIVAIYCALAGGAEQPNVATCDITVTYEFKQTRPVVGAGVDSTETTVLQSSFNDVPVLHLGSTGPTGL